MKLFHIQNYIWTQNTVKILNKDFIKAVRGGGAPVLGNFFIKFRFFFSWRLPLVKIPTWSKTRRFALWTTGTGSSRSTATRNPRPVFVVATKTFFLALLLLTQSMVYKECRNFWTMSAVKSVAVFFICDENTLLMAFQFWFLREVLLKCNLWKMYCNSLKTLRQHLSSFRYCTMSHNTGIFQNKNQQVSWKSQENKFCKYVFLISTEMIYSESDSRYCKCWVADNPVSQNFHEQGA